MPPVRVYELARELGVTSRELLERLAALDPDPPTSHTATVPPDLVAMLREGPRPRRGPRSGGRRTARGRSVSALAASGDESARFALGAQLIRDAFAAAKATGREDWSRMTVAVLKNRILSLTDRDFDESDWGVESFRAFVKLYDPEVVSVDETVRPASVDLKVEPSRPPDVARTEDEPRAGLEGPPVMTPARRIRGDLWRAVLDYSSGDTYIWDRGRALRVPATELAEDDARPRLPTITPEIHAGWQTQFAKQQIASGVPAPVESSLAAWAEQHRPSQMLPPPFRGQWNGELKRRVLERLEEWFAGTGISPPADLVESAAPPSQPPDVEQLRDLVIRCIRSMTREELEELRLPPAALLRTQR